MTDITGKIAALQASFQLMEEMTGSPSSATKVGLYANYFAEQKLAMYFVGRAVEEIMFTHAKGFWPTPEQIAARARELQRRDDARDSFRDIMGHLEEVFAQADAAKWEHRVTMANEWRQANPTTFKTVLRKVDQTCASIQLLTWVRESAEYRKSFRDGAIIQACNNQAAREERIAERKEAIARHERAMQFGATNVLDGAAA